MKLVSLKLKPKKRLRKSMEVTSVPSEPKYPWGSELNLEDEAIKKIGIDIENTKADDEVYFVARGKVTNLSMRDNLGGKQHSMSVQITDMGWGKP